MVSFVPVLDRSQPFAHGGGEGDGRGNAPSGRASNDLLSGRREGASGAHEPSQRCDGAQERARLREAQASGSGSATLNRDRPGRSDKAEVSGSSPLRPTTSAPSQRVCVGGRLGPCYLCWPPSRQRAQRASHGWVRVCPNADPTLCRHFGFQSLTWPSVALATAWHHSPSKMSLNAG